jgi:hypothetical protein
MEGRAQQRVVGANGRDALMAAGKHINSAEHGFTKKAGFNAIHMLGTRVLNCDAQKAKLNNDDFRAFMAMPSISKGEAEDSYNDGPTQSDTIMTSTTVTCETQPSPVGHPALAIRVPDVGQPYVHTTRGHWLRAGGRWVVMVLPVGPFHTLGVIGSGSFDSRLARAAPSRYRRGLNGDLLRHNGGLVWAAGYEDGGALVHERQYPQGYF